MKPKFIIFGTVLLLFLISACEQQFSPLQQNELTLKTEYVGVTDAELQLHVKNRPENTVFRLLRNDSTVLNGQLTTDDTLLYEENLRPNQNYSYQAILLKDGKKIMQSNSMTVNTMDTTSHEFTWEMIEIPSPYGSGLLRDVAIIDENNIWAVGEIYSDSAQPWLPYNAVHWDGEKWELKRIPFDACGAVKFPPIQAVYAFSVNDIWFARGGSLTHFDGNEYFNDCRMNPLLDGSITKIWGTDSNNLYAVGGVGTIAHYNGSDWQKLESGTNLPIQDIWGIDDGKDPSFILAVASKKLNTPPPQLLQISNNEVKNRFLPIYRSLTGVWFQDPSRIFLCGGGVYQSKHNNWQEFTEIPLIFTNRIRGSNINDIWAVGDFGFVVHFNGVNWKIQQELALADGNYYGLDVTDNLITAVGVAEMDAVVVNIRLNK